MRIVFISLLFIFCKAPGYSQDCHCFKPVFEIGLGPVVTLPIITEHKEDNVKPGTDETLNYSFHFGVRTHPSAFQAGLELIQDRQKFNAYLPLFWPSQETSHWNNYYTAYRLGLGANVSYRFGAVYFQLGGASMNELSHKTKSEIVEPGADPHPSPFAMYDSKSGVQLSAMVGMAWSEQSRFSTSIGFIHDTGEYEFNDETFLHHWKVRTNAITLLVIYQLNRI